MGDPSGHGLQIIANVNPIPEVETWEPGHHEEILKLVTKDAVKKVPCAEHLLSQIFLVYKKDRLVINLRPTSQFKQQIHVQDGESGDDKRPAEEGKLNGLNDAYLSVITWEGHPMAR